MGALSSSALTASVGSAMRALSGSAEEATGGVEQCLVSSRALAASARRPACARCNSRTASAHALHRPARRATLVCKRCRPAAAQAAGVSVREEQGAGSIEGLPALIPLEGAPPCWQLPHDVPFAGHCVSAAVGPRRRLSACLGAADEGFADAHAFKSYANWLIPGRLLLGRYPYVEPSRCRSVKTWVLKVSQSSSVVCMLHRAVPGSPALWVAAGNPCCAV